MFAFHKRHREEGGDFPVFYVLETVLTAQILIGP
jgi:hypothetical protein